MPYLFNNKLLSNTEKNCVKIVITFLFNQLKVLFSLVCLCSNSTQKQCCSALNFRIHQDLFRLQSCHCWCCRLWSKFGWRWNRQPASIFSILFSRLMLALVSEEGGLSNGQLGDDWTTPGPPPPSPGGATPLPGPPNNHKLKFIPLPSPHNTL